MRGRGLRGMFRLYFLRRGVAVSKFCLANPSLNSQ